jgi:hypothetical protein
MVSHTSSCCIGTNEFRDVTMETAIRNPDELFMTLMAKDVLTEAGLTVSLDIRYLMGARMDRPISAYEPFTLAIVTRLLLSAGFAAIRVLDPHSDVTCDRLGARPVLPVGVRPAGVGVLTARRVGRCAGPWGTNTHAHTHGPCWIFLMAHGAGAQAQGSVYRGTVWVLR